ncbi:MAG: hypothetical protein A2161_12095 [Candidatus Schekmanbacteria bacterium RBG_13_48_7]|uniref:Uncharacterized protein n=1 Tax=Candidatus Schekmanbacteria bacterium RBG_13_48_7 TaxID=1817878 RepID=A0A1F7RVZ7_9BACT|nr:MAG: hypothetical protein A2161_12095 [Candidatus Schekmanbacteria bacterium RBG_13_48_7]
MMKLNLVPSQPAGGLGRGIEEISNSVSTPHAFPPFNSPCERGENKIHTGMLYSNLTGTIY